MTAYRRALSKLQIAYSRLEAHTTSHHQTIADTALGTRLAYSQLIQAFEGSLRVQEKLVDMKPNDPMGPIVSEASIHTAAAEDAWKALPIAAGAGLSHALVDLGRRTADGRLAYLVVTKSERAALLSSIELLFGKQAASGKVAGLHPPEGTAGLIASFLLDDWRCSDEP
jgi:hypothetical protein